MTPAVTQPIVVRHHARNHRARADRDDAGLRPGDVIVQVRPVPIEGAAVSLAPRPIGSRVSTRRSLQDARDALDDPGISARRAGPYRGRARSERVARPDGGRPLGGLFEMAAAAEVRIRVDADAVLWFEPGVRVCREVGCDPWSTLASGTLLAAFPHAARRHCRGNASRSVAMRPRSSAPPRRERGSSTRAATRTHGPSATRWRDYSPPADPSRSCRPTRDR